MRCSGGKSGLAKARALHGVAAGAAGAGDAGAAALACAGEAAGAADAAGAAAPARAGPVIAAGGALAGREPARQPPDATAATTRIVFSRSDMRRQYMESGLERKPANRSALLGVCCSIPPRRLDGRSGALAAWLVG